MKPRSPFTSAYGFPPPKFRRMRKASQSEHGDRADWRGGTFAPLQRQADESELSLAQQRFQIAQAFDVGDAEVETGLVHQQVFLAVRAGPHRVDAEMHDAMPGQPFGRGNVY